jgi:hypothetical protein
MPQYGCQHILRQELRLLFDLVVCRCDSGSSSGLMRKIALGLASNSKKSNLPVNPDNIQIQLIAQQGVGGI